MNKYKPLLIAVILFLTHTVDLSAATGFYVKGELTLTIPARQLLNKVAENPDEPFTIYVYRDKPAKILIYTKEISEGTFNFYTPLSIPETVLLLRALNDRGLISTSDVILTGNKLEELRNQTGNPTLQGIVLTITTLVERYYHEMEDVDASVRELDFDLALTQLDSIQKNFLPSGGEFIYRVLQRRVEVLQAAFEHGKYVQEFDLPFIKNFSEGAPADSIPPTAKYKLLLQYIRALRQSPYKPTWKMSDGKSIADIVDDAFSLCIEFYLNTDRDPEAATSIAKEYLDHLNDTERYLKLVDIGGKYFEFVHFPDYNLNDGQKRAVVRTLVAMGDALAKGTNLNSYTTDEYLAEVGEMPEARQAWETYMKYLGKWKYFFPSNSKKLISRRVHRYYSVGEQIVQSTGEDHNGGS